MKINQLKLEVHDSYEKAKNLTTNFEPSDNSDVINKTYLDEKKWKRDGHISLLEKHYNEFKILSDKQSVEEVLIQRAVITTIQILYYKEIFDSFPISDAVEKDFSFVTTGRGDLEESKGCRSRVFFINIT